MKRKILSVAIMVSMMLSACAKPSSSDMTASVTPGSDMVTVSSIMAKYANADMDKDNSVAPLYNMAPDEEFDFNFRCNLTEEYSGGNGFVSVHTHKDCQPESMIYTYANYEETDDGGCILTISPIRGVLENKSDKEEYFIEDHAVWGNAPMYYIAIWYDMEAETLVKLKEPIIIPFTIKHEVQAPKVQGIVDSNGCFSLSWEPVSGAEEYRVYTLTNSNNSTGTKNEAINGAQNGYANCSLLFMESVDGTTFMNFDGSNENVVRFERSVSGKEYIVGQNYCVNGEYYVSAVVDGKESGFEKAIETSHLQIPYKFTTESDIMFARYKDVSELPLTLDVINIDGSVTSRKVMYTFQMEDTYLEGVQVPEYAYTIEGTALTGCVSMDVKDADYEFPQTIGSVSLTGFVEPHNDISAQPDVENEGNITQDKGTLISRHIEESEKKRKESEELSVEAPNKDMMFFADTPEEEWIALNLINGETKISVEAFPKLQVYDNLIDVLNKVYYQNPYILGPYEYSYDYKTTTIEVEYVYDKDEMQMRQQEICKSAKEIVAKIISKDMDETEKQLAIYEYLEENASYDHDALETAKENDYKKISDPDYEDSFNAYGVLVKKEGVCQSYACAYKLLCNMSGVDCNVVTGYLNGNLPHAWNGIHIEGDWYQTDITNNKNTIGIPYFLYNSDSITANHTGYTEDDLYDLDENIAKYYSENTDYEYYHANNLCASTLEEYQKVLEDALDNKEDRICIRYLEELPEQSEIIKAVSEVYHRENRENELADLSLAIKSGFVVLYD